jgi:hypothetical protein
MNRNEEYLELMKELEENIPDLTVCVTKARNRRNRAAFVYRPLAGLAACFALFVLLVNFSVPVAQACAKVPILRQLAEAVTFSKSLQDAVENDYVQQLNLTQEKDGITAKIEYVILDRKQVNIFYRLESDEHTYMYVNPKVLNKEGTHEEPCSWTTPINDVPNDQLRLITLDYNEEEVPGALQLMLYVYGKPNAVTGKENRLTEFTFQLEFDPNRIAEAKVYPVNQTVNLDGQSITVTEIQVYPTHLRMVIAEAPANTSWLQLLDFCIETEDGRFDSIQRGVVANVTEDGLTAYRADSIYFYEAKQIRVVITGARWLRKDMERIRIDLVKGTADALPEGVTLVPPDGENSMSPVMLHVRGYSENLQPIMLSMSYYDAEGNRLQASVAARPCGEHAGNCWHEWLSLKDYPHDHIWITLNYSHYWLAEEPVTITVQ